MLRHPLLTLLSNTRRCAMLLATLGVLGLLPSAALAVSILPADAAPAAGELDPTGGVLLDTRFEVFSSATFSGTLSTSVIGGDPSNPYGGLTFTYLVTNDASSSHAIGRVTFNGFTGFLTDASFQTPAGGVAPTNTDRSIGTGDTLGFSFVGSPLGLGLLVPGATSALLVVQTNAHDWQNNFASVINGTVTSADILAPTGPSTAVPEPSSALIFVSGLLVISNALRRS